MVKVCTLGALIVSVLFFLLKKVLKSGLVGKWLCDASINGLSGQLRLQQMQDTVYIFYSVKITSKKKKNFEQKRLHLFRPESNFLLKCKFKNLNKLECSFMRFCLSTLKGPLQFWCSFPKKERCLCFHLLITCASTKIILVVLDDRFCFLFHFFFYPWDYNILLNEESDFLF